ncbi:hypothetical protein QQ045_021229 [Rhodiola kirilowii]
MESQLKAIVWKFMPMWGILTVLRDEKHNGLRVRDRDTIELKEFVQNIKLVDMDSSGCFYTWNNNKANPRERIWSKLDRAMCNLAWFDVFRNCLVVFQPPGFSDHSPVVVSCGFKPRIRRSFKYNNFWELMDDYKEKVGSFWRSSPESHTLSNFQAKVREMKNMMKQCFVSHSVGTKPRVNAARDSLLEENIKTELGDFFKGLLGQSRPYQNINLKIVQRGNLLDDVFCRQLVQEVTGREIWNALQTIGSDKALDDMFLFCSGRFYAISTLKDTLRKFLDCSSFDINTNKSQVFIAGRKILIQSVLQATIPHWVRMYILPKQVILATDSICAKFLWNGCVDKKGGHHVKWEDVCRSKREVKDTYDTLMDHKVEVDWHKVVWNNFNTLRHALNAWLVLRNKLLTNDRMNKMGMSMDTKCVLCEDADESRDQIFSNCAYIQQVGKSVFSFLGIRFVPSQGHLLIPISHGSMA